MSENLRESVSVPRESVRSSAFLSDAERAFLSNRLRSPLSDVTAAVLSSEHRKNARLSGSSQAVLCQVSDVLRCVADLSRVADLPAVRTARSGDGETVAGAIELCIDLVQFCIDADTAADYWRDEKATTPPHTHTPKNRTITMICGIILSGRGAA